MKPDLSVVLAGIELKNPVMPASGTIGAGREYADLVDLKKFGAIVAKTVTLEPMEGNPPPRICETPSGLLNSIGLQNAGFDRFIEEDMPFLRDLGIPVIVNIAGTSVPEYAELCRRLSGISGVSAIEINVSCPNVKAGGMTFGTHPGLVSEVVGSCRRATDLPLIVKLTPNVSSIVGIARAAVTAGADALSLINTVLGMAIDPFTFEPRLATGVGGLSGPAIKPIAVRMVWEVAREVNVPVIGMGGIANALDAIEFFLAGARAVAVGTANFVNPRAVVDVVDGIEEFMAARGFNKLDEIVGKVRLKGSLQRPQ